MKTKKCLMCLIVFLFVVISSGGITAYAKTASVEIPAETAVYNSSSNTVLFSQGEETQWYFRYVDGKLQKRLWSLTFLMWLTDWEWVY